LSFKRALTLSRSIFHGRTGSWQDKINAHKADYVHASSGMLGCDDCEGAFEGNPRKVASVETSKKLAKTGKRLLRPGPDKA